MTGHRGQGGHTRCRENQSPGHGRAEPPSSVQRPVWTEAQGGETNSPQPRRGEEKGLGMGGRGLGPRGRFRRGRSGVCVGPSSLRPETGLHCRQKPHSRPGRPPPGAARRARRLSSTAPQAMLQRWGARESSWRGEHGKGGSASLQSWRSPSARKQQGVGGQSDSPTAELPAEGASFVGTLRHPALTVKFTTFSNQSNAPDVQISGEM